MAIDVLTLALAKKMSGSGSGGIEVTGASVGQTIVVKAVDDNGKPTEWETRDFPDSGGNVDQAQIEQAVADYIEANPVVGAPGADGKDGVSATHEWNGTVLTVTSASGTSSADLKGAKGDKGDKGDTGPAGNNGKDGKTPVKGTDYFTDADKAEMVNSVLAALPTWTGGNY